MACGSCFIGPARLRHNQLGFAGWSHVWQGGVANIFPTDEPNPTANENEPHNQLLSECLPNNEACVWGAVWRISLEDMKNLDMQEGVDVQEYEPVSVDVDLYESFQHSFLKTIGRKNSLLDQEALQQLVDQIGQMESTCIGGKKDCTISVRSYRKVKASNYSSTNVNLALPSDSYKLVILRGAVECGLPPHWIKNIALLSTNCRISVFSGWKDGTSEDTTQGR